MYHFPKLMETVWDEPLGSCAARLMCMSWLLIGWLLDFVWMFPLSRGKYGRRKSNLFQKHHHHSVIVQEMKEHFPKIHVWVFNCFTSDIYLSVCWQKIRAWFCCYILLMCMRLLHCQSVETGASSLTGATTVESRWITAGCGCSVWWVCCVARDFLFWISVFGIFCFLFIWIHWKKIP